MDSGVSLLSLHVRAAAAAAAGGVGGGGGAAAVWLKVLTFPDEYEDGDDPVDCRPPGAKVQEYL
jgi:hypothetical protein